MTAPEEQYQRWRLTFVSAWGTIGVLVLVSAGMWVLGRVASALVPFVIAFVIAFLFNWPVTELARRGMPRSIAAGVCIAVGFLLLGGLITLIGPFIGRQVVSFAQSAPERFRQVEQAAQALQVRYAHMAFPGWVSGFITAASARLSQLAVTLGNEAARIVVSTGGGMVTGFFNFVIAVVIAFWALKDLPKLRAEIIAIVGPSREVDTEHLLDTVTRVVGGYLRGQTIASLATGSIATIGLFVVGVPYALMLGFVTFLSNYVPYVGPFTAALVAGLVGLFKGPWTALFAVLVIVFAQNFTDTVITPRIMSEQVDLHPTLVIFSLLVGGTLFGIWGMLLAIPVAATGKGLFVYHYEQRTQRQLGSEDGALFRDVNSDSDDDR